MHEKDLARFELDEISCSNAFDLEEFNTGGSYDLSGSNLMVVDRMIADYNSVSFEKVSALPTTGKTGTIYLISNGGSGNNVYDEYFWDGTEFELFGTTAVDLSGYVRASDITLATNDDINGLFA